MTEASTDQVSQIKALYESFGQGDVPTVLASMDAGIEWYEAEGNPWSPGHPFVGPQQVDTRQLADVMGVSHSPAATSE